MFYRSIGIWLINGLCWNSIIIHPLIWKKFELDLILVILSWFPIEKDLLSTLGRTTSYSGRIDSGSGWNDSGRTGIRAKRPASTMCSHSTFSREICSPIFKSVLLCYILIFMYDKPTLLPKHLNFWLRGQLTLKSYNFIEFHNKVISNFFHAFSIFYFNLRLPLTMIQDPWREESQKLLII